MKDLFLTMWFNKEKYSCQSYGRISLYNAAKQVVPDLVIQAHHRWKSVCFQRYDLVEFDKDGETISGILLNHSIPLFYSIKIFLRNLLEKMSFDWNQEKVTEL
jgi:hypothetical protein